MFYDDGLRVTKKLPIFPRHDKTQGKSSTKYYANTWATESINGFYEQKPYQFP